MKQFCIMYYYNFCKQRNFRNFFFFGGFRQYVVLVLKVPLCFDKTSASTASFPIQIYIYLSPIMVFMVKIDPAPILPLICGEHTPFPATSKPWLSKGITGVSKNPTIL